MSAVTPGPALVEARRLARNAALLLIEKPGPIWYIYRPLPDGRKTFLGKRGTPEGARALVAKVAHCR
jgi:hypothetical protein